MAIAATITLSSEEKSQLERNVCRRKTPVRLQERSRIILLAAEGLTNGAIAEALGVSHNKVGRWRNRYEKNRHEGIEKDRPRGNNQGGKSSAAQATLRSRVIEMTMNPPANNSTHWSTRGMAKVLSVSDRFVRRVWKSCGFKPHLLKQFKISHDPDF